MLACLAIALDNPVFSIFKFGKHVSACKDDALNKFNLKIDKIIWCKTGVRNLKKYFKKSQPFDFKILYKKI